VSLSWKRGIEPYENGWKVTTAAGSLSELDYLENQDRAYAFMQLDQAFAAFDTAFQIDRMSQCQEFVADWTGVFDRFRKQILRRDIARKPGR